jgi:hypothetical protein
MVRTQSTPEPVSRDLWYGHSVKSTGTRPVTPLCLRLHRLERQSCGKIPAPVDGGASLVIELAQTQSMPGSRVRRRVELLRLRCKFCI